MHTIICSFLIAINFQCHHIGFYNTSNRTISIIPAELVSACDLSCYKNFSTLLKAKADSSSSRLKCVCSRPELLLQQQKDVAGILKEKRKTVCAAAKASAHGHIFMVGRKDVIVMQVKF